MPFMKTDDQMSRYFETLSLAKTRDSETASYKNRDCKTQILITENEIASPVKFDKNFAKPRVFEGPFTTLNL